jgi:hypothetical protein
MSFGAEIVHFSKKKVYGVLGVTNLIMNIWTLSILSSYYTKKMPTFTNILFSSRNTNKNGNFPVNN